MALTKSDIVAKVHELGFTKKSLLILSKACWKLLKENWKKEKMFLFPDLENFA